MPAPRLLDKRTANAEVATQKKQQIELGVSLAKKVDSVRETLNQEESKLETFRSETLKRVQIEIDAEIRNRDRIRQENALLREERIRLEAPVDLSQAWNEVRADKEYVGELKTQLLSQEIAVTRRENDAQEKEVENASKEAELVRTMIAAEENLHQAELERREAAMVRQEAQESLSKLEAERSEHSLFSKTKTESLDERESKVSERELEVQRVQIEITNEKIRLADQRATLEDGFAELRRKLYGLHR